jgi:ABC-type uncharacterized transport system substrate-binding protein
MLAAVLSLVSVRAGEVVIVTSSKAQPYEQARDASRKRLTDAGMNCTVFRLDELSDQRVKELAARKPAACLAIGSDAASFLHERLDASTLLCFCMVADPEAAGLTKGKPAVGITTEVPLQVQFDLVRQALPKANVMGVLYSSATEKSQAQLAGARRALPVGWRLEAVCVEDHGSVSKAIEVLLQRKVDCVWTWPDATLYNVAGVRALLLSAVRSGTPVYGFSRAFVRSGALLGIGVEPEAQGQQAAELIQEEIQHPPVQAQSVVHAPRGNIILNLIVAERLSLKLPENVVERAAEVIRPDSR